MSPAVVEKLVGMDVAKATLDLPIDPDKKSLHACARMSPVQESGFAAGAAEPEGAHRWLEKRIAEIGQDLEDALRASELWRVKDDLLRSIPGIDLVTMLTVLAKCPESGMPGAVKWPRGRGWPLWPTTAARIAGNVSFGVVAPICGPCGIGWHSRPGGAIRCDQGVGRATRRSR
jgi:hypothetical protein